LNANVLDLPEASTAVPLMFVVEPAVKVPPAELRLLASAAVS
jgi:hypothetical protein